MPNYRLYRLDPNNGHFIGVEEIRAADDPSAIHEIEQRAYGNSVELWDGGRKVTQIDAVPEAAAYEPGAIGRPLHWGRLCKWLKWVESGPAATDPKPSFAHLVAE